MNKYHNGMVGKDMGNNKKMMTQKEMPRKSMMMSEREMKINMKGKK